MSKSRRSRSILLFAAGVALVGAACVPTKPPAPDPEPDPCLENPVVITEEPQQCTWWFQRDMANETAGGLTDEMASTGAGSLKAGPIGATGAEKYIAENFIGALGFSVDLVDSIGYDFLIAGNGTDADANEFYLNVYTTIDDDPNVFYDCKFDYVPTTGSTAMFTTVTFDATAAPTTVSKLGDRIADCPTTLAEMPAGSFVRAFALNVGDTTTGDDGLAGFFDNVKVANEFGTATWDFEPPA